MKKDNMMIKVREGRTSLPSTIKGFTLLEAMIVVTIIGILASIVLPSYVDSVRKARRADAQTVLMQYSAFAERIFTQSNSYAGATKAASGVVDNDFYDFTPTITATSFTIVATAKGEQANDSCGDLSLAHTGATTPSTAGCW